MVDPDGTPPRPLNRLRWVVFALAVAGVVVFLTHGPDEQTVIRESGRWWATQLGTLPMTLVAANAGASLAEITSFREVISARVLGALCLLPLVPLVLRHTAGRLLRARSSPARG